MKLKDYDELLEGIEEMEEFEEEHEDLEYIIDLIDVKSVIFGVKYKKKENLLDGMYVEPFK